MKASLYHIELNVSDFKVSSHFYKDLLGYFDYTVMFENEFLLGLTNGSTDFWIVRTAPEHLSKVFHRKGSGLNHIAFRVSAKSDVDTFSKEFLKPRNIVPLYDSPHLFPEYTENYYAVYFEDPDRIKLEVAFL